jgi:hypothetical protein
MILAGNHQAAMARQLRSTNRRCLADHETVSGRVISALTGWLGFRWK